MKDMRFKKNWSKDKKLWYKTKRQYWITASGGYNVKKCKRCHYESRLDPSIRNVQFCPDLDGYFNLCMKCGTPERSARGHKLVGAVFE